MDDGGHSHFLDGLGQSFDTLSDGMDDKLKKAARTFVYSDEIHNEDYLFRPDVKFLLGMSYTPRVRGTLLTMWNVELVFLAPIFLTSLDLLIFIF